MSGGVNAACTPKAGPAQSAEARVHNDQAQALGVMKKMVTGEVSAQDGMKALQALVVDQAVAVGSLPPSAAGQASGGGTGFSGKDTFEAGGAKPAMVLNPGATDTSFLEKNSGGGAKPGIGSGSN